METAPPFPHHHVLASDVFSVPGATLSRGFPPDDSRLRHRQSKRTVHGSDSTFLTDANGSKLQHRGFSWLQGFTTDVSVYLVSAFCLGDLMARLITGYIADVDLLPMELIVLVACSLQSECSEEKDPRPKNSRGQVIHHFRAISYPTDCSWNKRTPIRTVVRRNRTLSDLDENCSKLLHVQCSRRHVSMLDALSLLRSSRAHRPRHGLLPWGSDIPSADVHHEKFWFATTHPERVDRLLHLRSADAGQTFCDWWVAFLASTMCKSAIHADV